MIANTGDSNSFAEIFWEDKLLPYMGLATVENDAIAQAGIINGAESLYRCPADLSVRRPYLDDAGGHSRPSPA